MITVESACNVFHIEWGFDNNFGYNAVNYKNEVSQTMLIKMKPFKQNDLFIGMGKRRRIVYLKILHTFPERMT